MADRPVVRNAILTLAGLAILFFVLLAVENSGSTKLTQTAALFAIWGIAAVSLNLINGVTGILSLGHHGFMLVGGYTTALLILSDAGRERISSSARSQMTDFTLGLSIPNGFEAIGLEGLAGGEFLWLHFVIAMLIGGLVAALFGLIVGIPSLRLRGDYLAIVTFGFGEIVRLLASTRLLSPFTNGSLGFSGVPSEFGKSVWWPFALLVVTVFVMAKLKFSSFGRALQAIREDEIAAEAMGVNLARSKTFAFTLSAFFAGIAGGLWVSWLATARLDVFLFFLTFFFLVAISVGGTGSITGVLFGTGLVVFVQQYGDPLENAHAVPVWIAILGAIVMLIGVLAWFLRRSRRLRPTLNPSVWVPIAVGFVGILVAWIGPSIPAMAETLEGTFRPFGGRRILLAVLLLGIMIFRPEGLFGRAEFSWAWLLRERRDEPSDEERAQDAWLSNPDLNKEREAAEAGKDPLPQSLVGEESPKAHPLTERGYKPGSRRDPERRKKKRDDTGDA